MGKCTGCGAALDPGWKFCIMCGEAIAPTAYPAKELGVAPAEETPVDQTVTDMDASSSSTPGPIPAAIRPVVDSDDELVPRNRPDIAMIVGVVVALGGGLLIILVAIALFAPRG